MRRLSIVCLCLTLAIITPAWSQTGNPLVCALPADLMAPAMPLVQVAAALTNQGGLDILALGSGSTVGEGTGTGGPGPAIKTPEASFPYRMVNALRAMKPKLRF